MKFLPGFNLLDDAFYSVFDDSHTRMMKTDVRENDNDYVLAMELPGFKKENITLSLREGYLNVSASQDENKEEKDEKGNVIRRERYTGSCNRSFYVGERITEEDIKAKFENGELLVSFPKEKQDTVETSKPIMIE